MSLLVVFVLFYNKKQKIPIDFLKHNKSIIKAFLKYNKSKKISLYLNFYRTVKVVECLQQKNWHPYSLTSRIFSFLETTV